MEDCDLLDSLMSWRYLWLICQQMFVRKQLCTEELRSFPMNHFFKKATGDEWKLFIATKMLGWHKWKPWDLVSQSVCSVVQAADEEVTMRCTHSIGPDLFCSFTLRNKSDQECFRPPETCWHAKFSCRRKNLNYYAETTIITSSISTYGEQIMWISESYSVVYWVFI